MARWAVYTSGGIFRGYVWAANVRHAKEQGRRYFNLIGEPNVFLCREG